MGRKKTFIGWALIVTLTILVACAATRERFVSVHLSPSPEKTQVAAAGVRITVNDFSDAREDRERVGVDYTSAADIKLREPVPVAVSRVVVEALKERGFFPITIKEERKVFEYSGEYDAEFHLTGEVEDLFVTVKRTGLLADYVARGRIFFRLYDRRGELLWSGRFSSEREVSSPFVSEKAIEEALSDCLTSIVNGFLNDEAVVRALGKKD